MRTWYGRAGSALLSVLLLWGSLSCSRDRTRDARAWSDLPVAVVQPAVASPGAAREVEACQQLFPDFRMVQAEALARELKNCLGERRSVIVPGARSFPVDALGLLRSFVLQGGNLLFLGEDPLADEVYRIDERFQPRSAWASQLVTEARSVPGLSRVQVWLQERSSPGPIGTVRLATSPDVPWTSVETTFSLASGSHALVSPVIAPGEIDEQADALVFFVRGDREARRVFVEARTDDGRAFRTWIRTGTAWRQVVLPAGAFEPRDGGKEALELARMTRLGVGLSTTDQPLPPGDHTLGLSDVRVVPAPWLSETRQDGPVSFRLLEEDQRFTFEAGQAVCSRDGTRMDFSTSLLQSVLPGPRGWHTDDHPYRWIPLYTCIDQEGHPLGWPGSLLVEETPGGNLLCWGWVGMRLKERTRPFWEALVLEGVRRARQQGFLMGRAPRRLVYEPGERIRVSMRYLNPFGMKGDRRVVAELVDPQGRVVRRAQSELLTPESVKSTYDFDLGRAPRVRNLVDDFALRVYVEDPYESQHRFDSLSTALKVLEPRNRPPREAWVSTTGSRFTLGKRPLYFLGANYAPARQPASGSWLEPATFDARLLRRDLDRIASTGMNSLSIVLRELPESEPVRYLLNELRARDMWLHVTVPALDIMDPEVDRAFPMLRKAGLFENERAWALELGARGVVGRAGERAAWAREWQDWLVEQFGSLAQALEQVDGLINGSGALYMPTDRELEGAAGPSEALALFRRFVHDRLSRGARDVVQQLRDQGLFQLVSIRHGEVVWGRTGQDALLPLDPATAMAHLDFVSLPAWTSDGNARDQLRLLRAAAYARGVSGGKPVLWRDVGRPASSSPDTQEQREQARYIAAHSKTALESHSAGFFLSGHPGARRGKPPLLLGDDGALLPAAAPVQRMANRMRYARSVPPAGGRVSVNPWADPRGAAAWIDRDDREVPSVRWPGAGGNSRTAELKEPGGNAYRYPGPVLGLNAEWTGVRDKAGRPLARDSSGSFRAGHRESVILSLVNTGGLPWAEGHRSERGTVRVEVTHGTDPKIFIPLEPAALGEEQRFTWTATDYGTWTFRAQLSGIGPFGEPLDIVVAPTQEKPTLRLRF